MAAHVFVSYSRRNHSFAERLHHDLVRAGVTVWRDTVDIPSRSPGWWEDIRRAIAECSHFLLLASPETAASETVQKELTEAHGKPIHRFLVGGEYDQLPDTWRAAQVTDFRGDYWGTLRRLLGMLGGPQAHINSLFDLLNGSLTVAGAAAELGTGTAAAFGAAPEFRVAGERFLGLPVEPSGYTMTRLIGPADAVLQRTKEIAILLGFTGSPGAASAQEVLEFWASQVKPAWLLWIDGPVNPATKKHELSEPHMWADAVGCVERMVEQFGRGRSVHLFFYCPIALGFAVGARLRQTSSYRLYNYTRGADGKPAYELVLRLHPS